MIDEYFVNMIMLILIMVDTVNSWWVFCQHDYDSDKERMMINNVMNIIINTKILMVVMMIMIL